MAQVADELNEVQVSSRGVRLDQHHRKPAPYLAFKHDLAAPKMVTVGSGSGSRSALLPKRYATSCSRPLIELRKVRLLP